MCIRDRGEAAAPTFSGYWVWSICGLHCRLYMAYVQLMYGPYMAYVWPTYGTYIHHIWPYEGLVICHLWSIGLPMTLVIWSWLLTMTSKCHETGTIRKLSSRRIFLEGFRKITFFDRSDQTEPPPLSFGQNWASSGRNRILAGRGSQTRGWGGQERAKEGQIRAI